MTFAKTPSKLRKGRDNINVAMRQTSMEKSQEGHFVLYLLHGHCPLITTCVNNASWEYRGVALT